ncbi:MAG: hypothetical protein IPL13_17440 [Saprospiraceae bacterium]|nr:hypothetical protein [Candidatus Brachybacter algidus]
MSKKYKHTTNSYGLPCLHNVWARHSIPKQAIGNQFEKKAKKKRKLHLFGC